MEAQHLGCEDAVEGATEFRVNEDSGVAALKSERPEAVVGNGEGEKEWRFSLPAVGVADPPWVGVGTG